MFRTAHRRTTLAALALACLACERGTLEPEVEAVAGVDAALAFEAWSTAVNVEGIAGTSPNFNTSALDGCPFVSPDGRMFFMASNREGSRGLDIWLARRASEDDPWGEPVNVGEPINSEYNDFCPTIGRDGHEFMFVSTRPHGCGGADIYISRMNADGTFDEPKNVGCHVNSPADEQSPFPISQSTTGPVLYFSSFRAGGHAPDPVGAVSGDSDIYMSEWHGGAYGPRQLVPGVNSDSTDAQPNVRRDGQEIFFFSTRPGGLGGPDIYAATRARTSDAWSEPVNLGSAINTGEGQSRPSLSWDGTTLYFGSGQLGSEGSSDIYVATRPRLNGRKP